MRTEYAEVPQRAKDDHVIKPNYVLTHTVDSLRGNGTHESDSP